MSTTAPIARNGTPLVTAAEIPEFAHTIGPRRRDAVWVAILATAFAFGLASSWQRWGNPLIDTGREMNQPLRLLAGETLYSDVRHIYGPLSPIGHAALYRVFGPSLSVLYVDGAVCAVVTLALIFWIGRQLMSPAAAGAATLSVMWLCVFKPAGNYILPYSYNAVHGTVLGLITLAMLVALLKDVWCSGGPECPTEAAAESTRRPPPLTRFLLAGVTAGCAVLAKTEIGAAAIAAGLTAALVSPRSGRRAWLGAAFLVPALLLPLMAYAMIASRVGWETLVDDSWLLLYNAPSELALFNARISGFDHSLRSIERMFIAAVKLVILAALVGAISTAAATRRRDGSAPVASAGAQTSGRRITPARVLLAAAALFAVMSVTTGLDWDKGPYLAMPLVLVALLMSAVHRHRRAHVTAFTAHDAILTTCCVYALVSLARTILHVRSGGAYGAYLLPVSVVLLTYVWMHPFADRLRQARARRFARSIVLTLIIGDAVVTAGLLAYRYRTRQTIPISTNRGTIVAAPDLGQAWNEALTYLAAHTAPGAAVAVLPEGTSINFLADRKNPLREEIVTPGFLDRAGEARAIRQLEQSQTALILVTNRPTREFGPEAFGRDYCQTLMRWIDEHYVVCAMFGPVKDTRLQIGDSPFFIRAYCPGSR